MLRIYNTLSRKKEDFVTLEPGVVKLYVCGVTVYNDAHVGHAMSALVFDIIRRYLEYRGYKVKHVMNFTDVDDKIINRANALGEDPFALAQRYIDDYRQNLHDLNILPATSNPRATQTMKEILDMVQGLVDKGYAYAASNGDVYFRVTKDEDYGKLSGRKLDDMQAGARIEVEEAKDHPMDFALWKSAKPGEPAWERPSRLAHRMLSHEPGRTRRTDRHPRRRQRSDLSTPRKRNRPVRILHRQTLRPHLDA
jgi:cysteinyl-tRNA synthetase